MIDMGASIDQESHILEIIRDPRSMYQCRFSMPIRMIDIGASLYMKVNHHRIIGNYDILV